MTSVLQFLAVMAAALFAGAALYINVAEHPARMILETRAAVLQWNRSYQRATWLQAPLAIISLLAGASVWLLDDRIGWLIAALCVGSVVPLTFAVIMPTNRRLLAPNRELADAETRQLLVRWGRLHAMRTALSLAGTVIYLWLLIEA